MSFYSAMFFVVCYFKTHFHRNSKAATASPNCYSVVFVDGYGQNHSQLVYSVYSCVFLHFNLTECLCLCMCVSWTKENKKKQRSLNSIVRLRFLHGERERQWRRGWLVCWCVNEYMYTLLYLCSKRIFGWCYCVCCWVIFFSTTKDQTIYQSEHYSIYLFNIYLSKMVNAVPFSSYDFV